MRILIRGLALLALVLIVANCKEVDYTWQYHRVDEAENQRDSISDPTILKAHLRNGEVYYFPNNWLVDTQRIAVQGYAYRYDANRDLLGKGEELLPLDSVVLFEVNKELDLTDGNSMLAPFTIINASISLVCLANPKACFGSCPTFYLPEDEGLFSCRAEGFSNAICPSLEYGDIDDLKVPHFRDSVFSLLMKNEAHETHVLREIELYALPIKEGEKVYQSRDNSFYATRNLFLAQEVPFQAADQEEYFSKSDPDNLASQEEVILNFKLDQDSANLGLVLDFRQSLMTTYFIYNAISYMGDEVGEIFSDLEQRGDLYETMDKGLKSELGELEVYLWNEAQEEWIFKGAFYETGPIAINRQILDLEHSDNNELRIKLKMNRGLWRIDRAAITHIQRKLKPEVYKVDRITRNGRSSTKDLRDLQSSEAPLVSMPGDRFQLDFHLAANQDYALFLYAKGYYLEWMRDAWLADKDLWKLRQMFKNPGTYLKNEAAAYKLYEENMEEVFWSSQVPAKPLSLKP